MRRPAAAAAAIFGVLGLCLLAAAPSLAHGGDPNYRSEIDSIRPPVEGVRAEVENFDSDLRLVNHSAETVVVEGYEGEPYLRFEPSGLVFVNENSPAAYLNTDRYARAEVPDDVDASAPPRWRLLTDVGEYAWHDHRSHYMGEGVPSVVTDRDVRTEVFAYSIPIEIGGRRGSINGTLYWVGQPNDAPVLPFVALAVVTALLVVVIIIVRRRRRRDADGGARPEAW